MIMLKFEVSMFTKYKDMKGNAKYSNGVVWGLEVTQCHWHVTIR